MSGTAKLRSRRVVDLLVGLVDKSLLLYEPQPSGPGRYRLLETTRQFAREKLRAVGQEKAAQRRHLEYFLTLAEEAAPHLSAGAKQGDRLRQFEIEHDNLRAALNLCKSAPDGAEMGLRLSVALSRFWEIYGYFTEGRAALAAALSLPGDRQTQGLRGEALNTAAGLARMQGDYSAAREYLVESLETARELGDKRGIVLCFNTLGLVMREQGDYETARACHSEGLAICRAEDDSFGVAHCLNSLGLVAYDQRDFPSAQAFLSEGLMISRDLDDRRGVAMSLSNLGLVANEQGDLDAARAWNLESLNLCREMGDRYGTASCLNNLGLIACNQKDYTSARAFHDESLAIRSELGDKRGIAMSLSNLGLMAREQGDYDTARECHNESLTICHDLGEKYGISEVFAGLAHLARSQGQFSRAACLSGAVGALRDSVGAPLSPSERRVLDGDLALLQTALGEHGYEAAWEEGRVMTLEKAVEFALGDPAPTRTPGGALRNGSHR